MKSNLVSYVQTSVTGTGTLSFAWSVAGMGALRLLDGTRVLAAVTNDTAWETRTIQYTNNAAHTLKWSYTQGASTNGRAYLDQVVWLPGSKTGVAVTAVASDPLAGLATGTGVYYAGAKVPLNAKPRPGWLFTGWTPTNYFAKPLIAAQTLAVSNNAISVTANFAKVPVVTGLPRPPEGGKVTGSGLCPPGRSVTLTAAASSGWLFMSWSDGATTASRSVSAGSDVTLSALFKRLSLIRAPVILTPQPQSAMVGVPFRLALQVVSECPPTVTVAGLPAGLTFNAGTRTISGVPSTVPAGGVAIVKISASNPGDTAQDEMFTLTVSPLPAWAYGGFSGWYSRDTDFGLVSSDMTALGKLTGKLLFRGTNYLFGASSYALRDADGAFWLTTTAKVGVASIPLTLKVRNPPGAVPSNLSVADGWISGADAGDPGAVMYRNVWKDAGMVTVLTNNYTGYYTATLPGGPEYGSGYLTFTIDKLGGVKTVGKLADGTAVSLAGPLILDEAGRVFAVLYTAPVAYKGGCLFGLVEFVKGEPGTRMTVLLLDNVPFLWENRSSVATQVYGAGFSRYLDLTGGWYDKLGNLYGYYAGRTLSVATETAPVPELVVGTNRYDSVCWTPDGLVLKVATNAAGVMTGLSAPKAGTPVKVGGEWMYDTSTNTVGLTIGLTRATGVFKGSFKAWFDYATTHTSKTIVYEGVLTPERENKADGIAGRGFFLWADKGSYLSPLGKATPYSFSWSYDLRLLLSEEALPLSNEAMLIPAGTNSGVDPE